MDTVFQAPLSQSIGIFRGPLFRGLLFYPLLKQKNDTRKAKIFFGSGFFLFQTALETSRSPYEPLIVPVSFFKVLSNQGDLFSASAGVISSLRRCPLYQKATSVTAESFYRF